MDDELFDAWDTPYHPAEEGGISRESSWPTNVSLRTGSRDFDHVLSESPTSECDSGMDLLGSAGPWSVKSKIDGVLEETQTKRVTPAPHKKPLNLLDLPIDILEVIVREIGSTTDLTSMALTHSVLHAIVVPQMYSRFDIVWPEPGDEGEVRSGVDALAFGLGTLAMSGSTFGSKVLQRFKCDHCGHESSGPHDSDDGHSLERRKVENYAQFTRKFSLGNGPSRFVQSYHISTESGKMLGTLVALAISRMKNLETFIWDMPTGIIREAWEALSSLGHDRDGRSVTSKLESVWIRCHDSKEVRAPSQNLHFFLPANSLSARYDLLRESFRQIEHPNFSILPPVKSLSVLQIDQIAYFEELSILLYNSLSRLRELRIGISRLNELAKEHVREDTNNVEGTFLNESSLTPLGANGVLGMLMSKFCRCCRQRVIVPDEQVLASSAPTMPLEGGATASKEASLAPPIMDIPSIVPGVTFDPPLHPPVPAPPDHNPPPLHQSINDPLLRTGPTTNGVYPPPRKLVVVRRGHDPMDANKRGGEEDARASKERFEKRLEDTQKHPRLKLQVLAFENVPLSVSVLTRALEWKFLTDITLLNCNSDENLWKALAKAFPPQPKVGSEGSSTKTAATHDFPLRLRRIHTDGVSNALLSFLRDNLAPNTLECLFLQDRKDNKTSPRVTTDSILKGPLRRHRGSLQKLSIDSAFKHVYTNGSWKKWLLNRDVLTFITSGKMSNLRELAVSVEYKDWHFLLQNLPGLPHLRSLYVPFVNEHVHAARLDAQELALQILDIVTLRPEIELCYIGILAKCFEILEGKNAEAAAGIGGGTDLPSTPLLPVPTWNNLPFLNHEASESSTISTVEDVEDEEEVLEPIDDGPDDVDANHSETGDSHVSEESEVNAPTAPKLRLREILFFAEKVEIFKVRHGTL